VNALLNRLGVELPIVQAGMSGGLSMHELAGEVSRAGGLGTVGFLPDPEVLAEDLWLARERADGRPVAANILLPFARRAHFEAGADAAAIVTFWGRPRRRAPGVWLHQCGSVAEALAAERAGADGVIMQGREAGGHVRGTMPALDLLAQARLALSKDFPVLSAGGMADAEDVAETLAEGADAAVLGTRFLMSDESGARQAYKQRLQEARETVVTELFGAGWAAPHRVIWNEATERWLRRDRRGPRWVRALNQATAPLVRRSPQSLQDRLVAAQRAGMPLLSPAPPAAGAPANLLDAGPLYAGESVARIWDIRPAGPLTRELAGAAEPAQA
jgi:nitronate monooxygenase